MNRRNFLKGILAAPAVFFSAKIGITEFGALSSLEGGAVDQIAVSSKPMTATEVIARRKEYSKTFTSYEAKVHEVFQRMGSYLKDSVRIKAIKTGI